MVENRYRHLIPLRTDDAHCNTGRGCPAVRSAPAYAPHKSQLLRASRTQGLAGRLGANPAGSSRRAVVGRGGLPELGL